ncbi:MAG: kelch repeat-containing protein [Pseudomonadota bacterium]|nr:kelch repeat-containing protein [Pseudomonadota bacterium]
MYHSFVSGRLSFAAWVCAGLLPISAGAQTIPNTLGWHELANTRIRPLCPSILTFEYGSCSAVTNAWGGAVLDAVRNRLYILGGGHADYAGNEVYMLDLDSVQMSRVNEPSFPVRDGCLAGNQSMYADGRPVSRHTYSNIEYLPAIDRILLFGGSRWQCGYFGDDTWLFDPGGDTWTRQITSAQPTGTFNMGLTRDPQTQRVYGRSENLLYSFDASLGTWTQRSEEFSAGSYKNAVLDPVRRHYYWYVQGETTLRWYDISNASANNLQSQSRATSGCAAFMADGDAGWQYDPVLDRLVAWTNGDNVYLLNPDTGACETRTFSNGPTAVEAGTFGRFRYIPSMNKYIVCNSIDANCHALVLGPANVFFSHGFE